MGYTHINDLLKDPEFSLKERVENLNIVIENSGKTKSSTSTGKATYADVVKRKSLQTPKTNVQKTHQQ